MNKDKDWGGLIMVDIEYLQKNYLNYDKGIMECAGDIGEDILKYTEALEMGGKEAAKGQWNDLYIDLVFLLTFFRIAGVDFDSCDFKKDVCSVLEYLERRERERHEENGH